MHKRYSCNNNSNNIIIIIIIIIIILINVLCNINNHLKKLYIYEINLHNCILENGHINKILSCLSKVHSCLNIRQIHIMYDLFILKLFYFFVCFIFCYFTIIIVIFVLLFLYKVT